MGHYACNACRLNVCYVETAIKPRACLQGGNDCHWQKESGGPNRVAFDLDDLIDRMKVNG